MNLAEARSAARENPRLKAAVARSGKKAVVGAGITDDPDVEITLYPLVGDAQKELKAQKEALEAAGYKVTFGTLSRGLLILEDGERAVSMAVVRRVHSSRAQGGKTDA